MSWIASKVRNGRYYDGRVRCHSGDEVYGEMFIERRGKSLIERRIELKKVNSGVSNWKLLESNRMEYE